MFLNNHGQNLLYISFGALGFVNYLYYSPIALFFFYGIVEFLNLKYPQLAINHYGSIIRSNRFYVMEGRCKLEIAFFVYLLLSLPFDLMGRLIKLFMIGQYLLIKYRISNEFRFASTSVNSWVDGKLAAVGFLQNAYRKVVGYVYDYANRNPEQQAPPQQ